MSPVRGPGRGGETRPVQPEQTENHNFMLVPSFRGVKHGTFSATTEGKALG